VEQLGARSRPKGHRDLPEVGAPARRVSLPEATVEPSPGFRRSICIREHWRNLM
jgi:hypothetical protein